MSQTGYLIIAVVIIIILLVTFIVSFVLYHKTPVPAGCEDLLISEEHCKACGNSDCKHYKKEEK